MGCSCSVVSRLPHGLHPPVAQERWLHDARCPPRPGPRLGGRTIQTFLPYPELDRSVRVLDTKRLGKQRVETLQIMQVLLAMRWDPTLDRPVEHLPKGWRRHPAVLMWQGHELRLLE